jgi:hypothetical protein
VAEVGTVHAGGRRIFAAVHRDTPRGVLVAFDEGGRYDKWIVGCADPETVAADLKSKLPG